MNCLQHMGRVLKIAASRPSLEKKKNIYIYKWTHGRQQEKGSDGALPGKTTLLWVGE